MRKSRFPEGRWLASSMVDIPQIATKCRLGSDGIWYAGSDEAVSYPSDGHDVCAQVEASSFWFKHRNACIVAAVQTHPPAEGETIFDIGGGNGFVSLGLLRAGFDVAVVEPGAAGALTARKRGIPTVVCATTTAAGFVEASLGAVGLFDVIEHVQRDVEFLSSLRALLRRGGRLYATVPAYQGLWSDEDVSAGHFRRYTIQSICLSLEQAGFMVDYATYIFRPLPLPILLMRTLPYRLGISRRGRDSAAKVADDHMTRHGSFSRALLSLLSSEVTSIKTGKRMGFGGSCLIVARSAG